MKYTNLCRSRRDGNRAEQAGVVVEYVARRSELEREEGLQRASATSVAGYQSLLLGLAHTRAVVASGREGRETNS